MTDPCSTAFDLIMLKLVKCLHGRRKIPALIVKMPNCHEKRRIVLSSCSICGVQRLDTN